MLGPHEGPRACKPRSPARRSAQPPPPNPVAAPLLALSVVVRSPRGQPLAEGLEEGARRVVRTPSRPVPRPGSAGLGHAWLSHSLVPRGGRPPRWSCRQLAALDGKSSSTRRVWAVCTRMTARHSHGGKGVPRQVRPQGPAAALHMVRTLRGRRSEQPTLGHALKDPEKHPRATALRQATAQGPQTRGLHGGAGVGSGSCRIWGVF